MNHATLRTAVRNILLFHWDPCMVKNIPSAHNEYDGSISGIIRLLTAGADHHRVVQHLRCLERQEMGFPEHSSHLDQVVNALLMLTGSARDTDES